MVESINTQIKDLTISEGGDTEKQMVFLVGKISKNVRRQDLVDQFVKFGKCEVSFKSFYAFIEYENDRDARDARRNLNGKDMDGLKILIKQIDKKQLAWIKAIAVARAVQKNSEIQVSLSNNPPNSSGLDNKNRLSSIN